MVLKAVFFDLDDTLVPTGHIDRRAYAKAIKIATMRSACALDENKFLADYTQWFKDAPWDPEHKVEVTEWRANLWCRALQAQKIPNSESLSAELQANYDDARLGEFQFSTEVTCIIRKLEEKGLAIVIITNGHHKIQRAKLYACQAHLYISDPARIIVGGEEVLNGRAEKPAASIFLQACRAVGCTPREAIHVGDSLGTDVLGGNGVGLCATVWLNPEGKTLKADDPVPSFDIRTLSVLPGIVDTLLMGT